MVLLLKRKKDIEVICSEGTTWKKLVTEKIISLKELVRVGRVFGAVLSFWGLLGILSLSFCIFPILFLFLFF